MTNLHMATDMGEGKLSHSDCVVVLGEYIFGESKHNLFTKKSLIILSHHSLLFSGRDPQTIERANLLNVSKLIIKELIDSSLSHGRMLDDNHVPLQQFFVVLEHVLRHGLKRKSKHSSFLSLFLEGFLIFLPIRKIFVDVCYTSLGIFTFDYMTDSIC